MSFEGRDSLSSLARNLGTKWFLETALSRSVEDCVYHMQLAELVMESDLAMLAEERTDSTALVDWEVFFSAGESLRSHVNRQAFKERYRLNGVYRAQKAQAERARRNRDIEQVRERERVRKRAQRAARKVVT